MELEKFAELCFRHITLCVADEVYEHVSYEREHVRIATIPDMWERTVTIGSGGKTFSSTGIRVFMTNAYHHFAFLFNSFCFLSDWLADRAEGAGA